MEGRHVDVVDVDKKLVVFVVCAKGAVTNADEEGDMIGE